MEISKNFSYSEVTEWYKFHKSISKSDIKFLTDLFEKEFTDEMKVNAKRIVDECLQPLRDVVNEAFPQYKGKIGIRATSWFRPFRWEKRRRRSGGSMHVKAHAVDFIVVGVSKEDYPIIMKWIWDYLNKGGGWKGGLARLFKNNVWSFIHVDLGRKRRWEY